MVSELDLELEALFARIESPESYEVFEDLFSGNADLAHTYNSGQMEGSQQQKHFKLIT